MLPTSENTVSDEFTLCTSAIDSFVLDVFALQVGAALPEVARTSCPVTHRQRGFCNASVAPNDFKGSSHGSDSGSDSDEEKVEELLRNALTSPARLALSGKLMG